MFEAWQVAKTEIILISLLILSGILGGMIWGRHSVRAPFRERRLTRRTPLQRLKWYWTHRFKPGVSHA